MKVEFIKVEATVKMHYRWVCPHCGYVNTEESIDGVYQCEECADTDDTEEDEPTYYFLTTTKEHSIPVSEIPCPAEDPTGLPTCVYSTRRRIDVYHPRKKMCVVCTQERTCAEQKSKELKK